MNQYAVDIRWRPNVNRHERKTVHWTVSAPNKQAALVIAGNRIGHLPADDSGLQQSGMVPASVQVTITRMPRPA